MSNNINSCSCSSKAPAAATGSKATGVVLALATLRAAIKVAKSGATVAAAESTISATAGATLEGATKEGERKKER